MRTASSPFPSLPLSILLWRALSKRFNFHVIFNHPFSCCSFANNFLCVYSRLTLPQSISDAKAERIRREKKRGNTAASLIFILAFRKYVYTILSTTSHPCDDLLLHVHKFQLQKAHTHTRHALWTMQPHACVCMCVCAATGVVCSLKPQN